MSYIYFISGILVVSNTYIPTYIKTKNTVFYSDSETDGLRE